MSNYIKHNIKQVDVRVKSDMHYFVQALTNVNDLANDLNKQTLFLSEQDIREKFNEALSIVAMFAHLNGMDVKVTSGSKSHVSVSDAGFQNIFDVDEKTGELVANPLIQTVNGGDVFKQKMNYMSFSPGDITDTYRIAAKNPFKPHITRDGDSFNIFFFYGKKYISFEFMVNLKDGDVFLTQKALRETLANTLFNYMNVLQNSYDQMQLKEKLEHRANKDALTGLDNRRYVTELLEFDVIPSVTKEGDMILGVMDIDKFKRVNSIIGHDGGDKVLVEFADVLKNQFRSSDVIGRIGGEEFLFTFKSEKDLTVSQLKALIKKVEGLREAIKGRVINLGMGLYYPTDRKSEDSLLSIMINVVSYMNEFDGFNLNQITGEDIYLALIEYGYEVSGISNDQYENMCDLLAELLTSVNPKNKEWRVALRDNARKYFSANGVENKPIVLSLNISTSIGLTISDKNILNDLIKEHEESQHAYSELRTKMFQEADRSLQAAKDQGRDRVVFSPRLLDKVSITDNFAATLRAVLNLKTEYDFINWNGFGRN